MKKMTFTTKEQEIINLGISIASGCQPCTKYHIKKCKEAGVSEKEIYEIIEQTEQLAGKAIEIMKQGAISNVNIDQKKEVSLNLKCENRIEVLVGLSVSCTLNNTNLLEFYLEKADDMEISISEISLILESSKFIFGKAKVHVEILSESKGIKSENNDDAECKPGCGC